MKKYTEIDKEERILERDKLLDDELEREKKLKRVI